MTAKKSSGGGASSGCAYIYIGPETGRRNAAVEKVRKKLAAGGMPPEETVFYADESAADQIISVVQNHSLFAESRLFIIKNADQIKDRDVPLMVSCMKEMEAGTALILVSDRTKLDAKLDAACPKENREIFYEMFDNDKNEWVHNFFRNEGYSIDPDAVDAILELVENNTEDLRRECARLMFFLSKDHPIEAGEVEKWLSHSREESTLTLFSRIAAGDASKAVESMQSMLAANESLKKIMGGLISCFKNLREYMSLMADGETSRSAFMRIRLFSPKAQADYASAASRYSIAAAESCIALTAEYDILTSASGAPWRSVLMDAYIIKLMQLGKK